jgi:hypothetical protein
MATHMCTDPRTYIQVFGLQVSSLGEARCPAQPASGSASPPQREAHPCIRSPATSQGTPPSRSTSSNGAVSTTRGARSPPAPHTPVQPARPQEHPLGKWFPRLGRADQIGVGPLPAGQPLESDLASGLLHLAPRRHSEEGPCAHRDSGRTVGDATPVVPSRSTEGGRRARGKAGVNAGDAAPFLPTCDVAQPSPHPAAAQASRVDPAPGTWQDAQPSRQKEASVVQGAGHGSRKAPASLGGPARSRMQGGRPRGLAPSEVSTPAVRAFLAGWFVIDPSSPRLCLSCPQPANFRLGPKGLR